MSDPARQRDRPEPDDGPGDAALAAHDVRNLLGVALGNAELLEREVGEAQRGRVRALRRAIALAGLLSEEMLAAAAGSRPAPFEEVDLGTVAHAATADFRARADEGVVVQFAGPEGRVHVRGRLSELARALLNLMWNALDAMEEAGTRPPRLDLAWGSNENGPWIEVRDYGPGLPPAMLAELARPFRTTRADGRVRGLGLAGVQRILRNHGGALVAAAPAAGPGAVLRLQFGVQRELEFRA